MASKISPLQLLAAKDTLETLKRRVENEEVPFGRPPVVVDITTDLDSNEKVSTTKITYEIIDTITANRLIILYKTVLMPRVEFAICDKKEGEDNVRYTCMIVDEDGVLAWMTPTHGEEPSERARLLSMTRLVQRLSN
jgi:hypothetical protein